MERDFENQSPEDFAPPANSQAAAETGVGTVVEPSERQIPDSAAAEMDAADSSSADTEPTADQLAAETTEAIEITGSAEYADAADASSAAVSAELLDAASDPFVGRWNQLISKTNWEKGKIIVDWRQNLIDQQAPVTEYSDEAWVRRVGGVTAPHVGRLRRVHEAFGDQYATYPGLYWSHFLAALDWDDAPLWLEGAMRSGWSVSQMRDARWQASGAAEADAPQAADIISADTDEDVVMPAQGGGSEGRFDKEPDGVTAGPLPEGPDFGELPDADNIGDGAADEDRDNLEGPSAQSLVQPFAGLPELPADLSEALEMFKLAIIRHKVGSWSEVAPEVVHQALDGLKLLINSRAE
ncbi:hypothetical protein SH139x_002439 [Planctomycetaceae bacterium SH139]